MPLRARSPAVAGTWRCAPAAPTAIAAVTVVAGLLDPRALLAATAGTGALVLFARAYRQSLEVQARRTAGTPNGADERQAVEADLPSCTVVVPLASARADTLATCWRTLADLRYPVAQLQGIAVIAEPTTTTRSPPTPSSAPPPWMQLVEAPAGTHRPALALARTAERLGHHEHRRRSARAAAAGRPARRRAAPGGRDRRAPARPAGAAGAPCASRALARLRADRRPAPRGRLEHADRP